MSDAASGAVVLRDERSDMQATFMPRAGMLCASLRHRGEELLAQNAGVDAYASRGKTMGIPLLYPWANRLAGFDYTVRGRKVSVPRDGTVPLDGRGLPIHGVMPGSLGWKLERTEAAYLAARLTWSAPEAPLFAVFPFHHDVEYVASLSAGLLAVQITVRAVGEDAVPVTFGFHPYLTLPGSSRDRWLIDLPAMRRLELDDRQIPVAPGADAPAERFQLGQREFDDGFGEVAESARFALSSGTDLLTLRFVEGYRFAQVYAPAGRDFICFEPMSAPTNALRSGVGLTLLEPGESRTSAFTVAVGVLP